MTTTFYYFTLEEVYQYAEKMGYSREDVTIECYDEEEYEVGRLKNLPKNFSKKA